MVLHDGSLKLWFELEMFSDHVWNHAALGICLNGSNVVFGYMCEPHDWLIWIGVLCIDLILGVKVTWFSLYGDDVGLIDLKVTLL